MPAPHSLHGTWEMIRAESAGENSPDLLALRVELEIAGDNYLVRFAGQTADRGTFILESDRSLTLLGVEGPNRGRTIPCIFQQKGDRLRICYGLDGVAPVAFTTASHPQHYLATYRRL